MNVLKSLQVTCKKKYSKQEAVISKSRICETCPIKGKVAKLSIFLHSCLDLNLSAFNEIYSFPDSILKLKMMALFNQGLITNADFHP